MCGNSKIIFSNKKLQVGTHFPISLLIFMNQVTEKEIQVCPVCEKINPFSGSDKNQIFYCNNCESTFKGIDGREIEIIKINKKSNSEEEHF
jgi:ribosomal protein L37AE/L43A